MAISGPVADAGGSTVRIADGGADVGGDARLARMVRDAEAHLAALPKRLAVLGAVLALRGRRHKMFLAGSNVHPDDRASFERLCAKGQGTRGGARGGARGAPRARDLHERVNPLYLPIKKA